MAGKRLLCAGKQGQKKTAGKRLQKKTAGKRVQKRRRSPLPLAAAGAALCLLVVICGGTYSYFSGKDHVVNQLDISELDFVIEEPSWQDPDTPVQPGDVLPKDPQIVNTGEIPFVVRVKLQEVWTPKKESNAANRVENPGYIRFFAADQGGLGPDGAFTAQQLLDILQDDSQVGEGQKNFALRLALTPNRTNPSPYWDQNGTVGWYRGRAKDSEWLYYNQIVPVTGRTAPVFRAVTIRTAEDVWPIETVSLGTGETLEQAHARVLAEYNKLLTQYDLDIYVYAETVQADAFAWKDAWADDLPAGWEMTWGGDTA